MQKIFLFILGFSLIAFGGYRQLAGSSVSPADQLRCEQVVRDRNEGNSDAVQTLLPMCSDPGMVAMMDAQAEGDDARAAAQRISAANQSDTGAHLLDWALIGAGLVALTGTAVVGRRHV